ncbi:hypothetical protein NQ315_005430 [Exocentrus adspersus]|uniref:Uncharacterized protein n=1 Tax=Exocentrus adspersus TaxID=1586481 RepID=A0AAV8V6E7_9CUCU|nr:hypothetical protein NQ315_005430 [Exocentrus adspersus]
MKLRKFMMKKTSMMIMMIQKRKIKKRIQLKNLIAKKMKEMKMMREIRKKDKDKKRKERVKLYTKDKQLLLSFVYFDQTNCGYIFDKDIEDLLYTLGLKLSRAQVRKLVSKVVTRDSLHYRKLTDKPRDDDLIVIDDSERDANLHELALGNKKLLLTSFGEESITKKRKLNCNNKDSAELEEGFVMFRGSLVDISKLISQLERSERARLETEAKMVELKSDIQKISEKYAKCNSSLKHLNSEIKEYREKLRNSDESLNRITVSSQYFFIIPYC